jgi:hypothetical protein
MPDLARSLRRQRRQPDRAGRSKTRPRPGGRPRYPDAHGLFCAPRPDEGALHLNAPGYSDSVPMPSLHAGPIGCLSPTLPRWLCTLAGAHAPSCGHQARQGVRHNTRTHPQPHPTRAAIQAAGRCTTQPCAGQAFSRPHSEWTIRHSDGLLARVIIPDSSCACGLSWENERTVPPSRGGPPCAQAHLASSHTRPGIDHSTGVGWRRRGHEAAHVALLDVGAAAPRCAVWRGAPSNCPCVWGRRCVRMQPRLDDWRPPKPAMQKQNETKTTSLSTEHNRRRRGVFSALLQGVAPGGL